jgi:hypothetical protein
MEITTAEIILQEIQPLSLSKASAEGHAEILADLVKNGEVNPLDMATRLKYIMAVCEQTLSQIQPDCVAAAENYSKDERIIVNNARVQVAETGVKYDYESTGDQEWFHFNRSEKEMAEGRKKRETFLKTLEAELTIADTFTGEIHTIKPPVKKSSSVAVKITFES